MVAGRFDLAGIQSALADAHLDGWLLYDFRGINPLARRLLGMHGEHTGSRRWFCYVPASGHPRKLVHELEPFVLDHVPGDKLAYISSADLQLKLKSLLNGSRVVAMEYSPLNAIPTISRVDAGTVEAVRACGVDVVTSGDLIQLFDARLTDEQWAMHCEAAEGTRAALDVAWNLIRAKVLAGLTVRESEVQTAISTHLIERGLTFDHSATVAVGPHSSDPHYSPTPDTDSEIGPGDLVLIDLWAKVNRLHGVYSDVTCMAYVGESVPSQYQEVFSAVVAAREAAIGLVRESVANDVPLRGWEVDRVARSVIEEAGYGAYFIHRTGHSIGEELHGNGANIDDFETREERQLLRRTCFSIEPGVYLADFGVRSEVDVFIDSQGIVHVTGLQQSEVLPLLKPS